MRIHSSLDSILRGRGTLHVLRQFCLRPGSEFTAAELARSGGLALSHVQGALALLERHGLVDRHVRGRSHYWSLERGNLLIEPLRALFQTEQDVSSRLNQVLEAGLRGLPIRRAVLFGSIPRGEDTGWSDVDLFLEVASEEDRESVLDGLVPLLRLVRDTFGLNLSPVVVRRSRRVDRVSRSFLREVELDGVSLMNSP